MVSFLTRRIIVNLDVQTLYIEGKLFYGSLLWTISKWTQSAVLTSLLSSLHLIHLSFFLYLVNNDLYTCIGGTERND